MSLWRDQEDLDTEKKLKEKAYNARNRKADEVHEVLGRIKDLTFEEGDFLVRQDYCRHRDDNWNIISEGWETEKFSHVNDSPRKYKVVYVDEVGLPYIQKVLMKGGLNGEAKCLAGFDLSHTKFIHDPDFVDHTIFNEEDDRFDPQDLYKEKRDEHFKTRPKRKAKQAEVLDGDSDSSVREIS